MPASELESAFAAAAKDILSPKICSLIEHAACVLLKRSERPPLGAAFSHARASGKDKSKEAQRRRANNYLKDKGLAPVGKTVTLGETGAEPLFKTETKWQKIMYCVIYSPNERDSDGEYMEAACIEKMAHAAMLERVPIHFEHQGVPIDVHLVESYVAPVPFEFKGRNGPQTVRKGAWVGAFAFNDDTAWQMVLDGKIKAVSVGGLAVKELR